MFEGVITNAKEGVYVALILKYSEGDKKIASLKFCDGMSFSWTVIMLQAYWCPIWLRNSGFGGIT